MALSPLKAAALSRRANKTGTPKAASLKNSSFNPKSYSMKGQGKSAAYRGAVGKAGRSGMSMNQAHRAGLKAEQAYAGGGRKK